MPSPQQPLSSPPPHDYPEPPPLLSPPAIDPPDADNDDASYAPSSSNMNSEAPSPDLSPLPLPDTPTLTIPLRNSIMDNFEDDSCNPAVIRLPA
ncbi:hypothetical protein QBC32DRAFT_317590 [Pseudoneurospora amorphoporcata]|uniref:Uncharacterized protein n=1 Tax=Pseudoneurospora amorphoporcata TaxID=241081 RepID=A0AAN6NR26_9PEZI|nr:hypothetical protein QBC32DRAFT_317590 [Pseudoneurospora amorphoporcata]